MWSRGSIFEESERALLDLCAVDVDEDATTGGGIGVEDAGRAVVAFCADPEVIGGGGEEAFGLPGICESSTLQYFAEAEGLTLIIEESCRREESQ